VFRSDNRNGAMKPLLAVTLAAALTTSTAALADALPCDIGYVTGVGGSVPSLREYLATPKLDQFRFLRDNDIHCEVSDEGRASACTGVTNLSHARVSLYEDIDSTLVSVVARVELEHGTYPVIIAVPKKDVQCEQ
jgi:hypothetical protein